MNIKVGLNIYNKAWLIEPTAAVNLLEMWERIKTNDTTWAHENEEQTAAYSLYAKSFANQNVSFAPTDFRSARDFKGFDGAKTAVIPVQGPLMKADFCGDFGTASLLGLFRLADNTPSIQSIILLIDSPGGTVDGTAAFAEAISKSKKATLSVVDEMACSAAYWIGSSADEMVATTKNAIVGSIGTMAAWHDQSERLKQSGIVLREYFATRSTDKNRTMREASAGDGRMLVQELLDPFNNEFLSAVKINRAGKIDLEKEDVLTGKTYIGNKAKQVGLIDNITTFDKAVQRSLQLAQQKQSIKMGTTPFAKTLKAAGAQSFEVVDNIGFGLTEPHLTSIEATLTAAETNLQAVTGQRDALQQQLTQAQQAAAGATTQANQDLEARDLQIANLTAEVAALKKQPAAGFTQTVANEDQQSGVKVTGKDKYRTSYDVEMDEYRNRRK